MLAIGGIVALLIGSLMLIRPDSGLDVMRISRILIISTVAVTSCFFLFVIGMGLKAQRRKPVTGIGAMVGETAVAFEARSILRGKSGCAEKSGMPYPFPERSISGEKVRVKEVKNLTLYVERSGYLIFKNKFHANNSRIFFSCYSFRHFYPGAIPSGFFVNMNGGVIFRLGRLVSGGEKGPGLIFLIPIVDRMVKVSLRTVVMDVPPQDVITQDNVSIKVNAVIYFRVLQPYKAIVEVENYLMATSQFSQTTLRSVLGTIRTGRPAFTKGKNQSAFAADYRFPYRTLGDQSIQCGSETDRSAAGNAKGDGQTGRGRKRAPFKSYCCRRRIPGFTTPGRRSKGFGRTTQCDYTALSANPQRDCHRE